MTLTAVKTDRWAETGREKKRCASPQEQYQAFCKPKMVDLLEALGLDVAFERASGSYVYYRDPDDGQEIQVLDLVGGFGTNLFGHNHPELRHRLLRAISRDCPMFVQGAVRSEAARLAAELNAHLPADGTYYCNFANSGAEAVEGAIKHAYKVRFDAVRRTFERISRQLNDFYYDVEPREQELIIPDNFADLTKFRDRIDEHNLAQFESFQNNPVVAAFKGAFHGKTTSALKATFNKTYREAFEGLSSIRTEFFEPSRPERVEEIVAANRIEFLIPRLEGNEIALDRESMTTVIGVIMETVQGEGGVFPAPFEALARLAGMHEALGVPYIIDEVQTGMGRAGAVASYSETPLSQIEPEYLVFGKALGGGLVKISATLVHETVYDPDFGLLHTSTFGEDELSCYVARGVLEMLTRNESLMLREINAKGDYFRNRLEGLKKRHPDVVKEIRGRGMMLGLEFTDLGKYGPLFSYAGRKGFVSLLVASYLLHEHDVRILAPLSTLYKGNPGKKRRSIIRLQPPVTMTHAEIDAFIDALEEAVSVIESDNEFILLAHLIGEDRHKPPVRRRESSSVVESTRNEFDARIGFLVHVTLVEYLLEYYLPAFKMYDFDERKLVEWWNKLARFLEPDRTYKTYIESGGFVVEANVIVVPYTAEYMIRTLARGRSKGADRFDQKRLQEMRDKIMDAAITARDLGDERIPTSVVGLGAFTSIVTDNGLELNDYEIPITTGNAYTTGLMLQGAVEAVRMKGWDLTDLTVAVVGATGNIGGSLAQLLAPNVGEMVLIGKGGHDSRQRLVQLRELCRDGSRDGQSVRIGSMDDLQECDVVLIATNSTNTRLIGPDKVKPGAIVGCASVPSNLSDNFKDHLDKYFVFDGGYARLPEDSRIEFVGLPRDGLAFGCMSETLLLGFEGIRRSFAKGRLTPERVCQSLEMADTYGFSLAEFQLAGRTVEHSEP